MTKEDDAARLAAWRAAAAAGEASVEGLKAALVSLNEALCDMAAAEWAAEDVRMELGE